MTVNYQDDKPSVTKEIEVTVDNKPPNANIIFPFPNQEYFPEDEWIVVQAQVTDNFDVETVRFFVDDGEEPFAIRSVPPYTQSWTIPVNEEGEATAGCHAFFVEAEDSAGNKVRSQTVSGCVVLPEE